MSDASFIRGWESEIMKFGVRHAWRENREFPHPQSRQPSHRARLGSVRLAREADTAQALVVTLVESFGSSLARLFAESHPIGAGTGHLCGY